MEDKLISNLEELKGKYREMSASGKMTINQEASLSKTIKEASVKLMDFYIEGAKVPKNIRGTMFGMRRNKFIIEIGCTVEIGKNVQFIKVQDVTVELAVKNWNEGKFTNSGLNLKWDKDQIVQK